MFVNMQQGDDSAKALLKKARIIVTKESIFYLSTVEKMPSHFFLTVPNPCMSTRFMNSSRKPPN